jgi:NAD(P)H-hydrate epimerase
VIDADALSVVPGVDTDATLVCTPTRHELAAMGGPDVDDLRDATNEIESFAADLGHVVLAKAAEDVISDGETTRVCRAGTPGMTVGGTGDVLAGLTAAFLATHEPHEAACTVRQRSHSRTPRARRRATRVRTDRCSPERDPRRR